VEEERRRLRDGDTTGGAAGEGSESGRMVECEGSGEREDGSGGEGSGIQGSV
jgi:hypothetical protein